MSRTVYYDSDGNEIYNDMPTYAQEQLADIEHRRAVSDVSSNENVDELKSKIKKYKIALELASVDIMKYIEEGLERCETCPERAYCQEHRHDMTLFDCGNVFLRVWKEKAGLSQ